jgi:hypothetical protein
MIALKAKQRGFLLNPCRFGGGGGESDPDYASVSLLLHGGGTNGSTTFTDNSGTPKSLTVFGNAQISTAQSKFGGSSILLDGVGDYLKVPSSASFNFGTANCTIEMWVRPNSTTTYYTLFNFGAASYGGWYLRLSSTGVLTLNVRGTQWSTGTNTVYDGNWHHIALVISYGNVKIYFDGVAGHNSSFSTYALDTGSDNLFIGYDSTYSTSAYAGYIDDLRMTKGVARYTADFTPPTAEFPNT